MKKTTKAIARFECECTEVWTNLSNLFSGMTNFPGYSELLPDAKGSPNSGTGLQVVDSSGERKVGLLRTFNPEGMEVAFLIKGYIDVTYEFSILQPNQLILVLTYESSGVGGALSNLTGGHKAVAKDAITYIVKSENLQSIVFE